MSPGPESRRERNIEHSELQAGSEATPHADLPADVLSEIVAETASRLTVPEEIDPALREALAEVARRLIGQPLSLDPVATALVEAVLRIQLPAIAQRPPLLTRTARAVAGSLLADPAARLRVQHLWATLAEDAA
jgi:hypothetical protein